VGGNLTFDNIPIVPSEEQFYIDITVVLEDTARNTPNKSFTNRATWDFGRLIDGTFYEPLPGEWGISAPLTISAPQLTVTKTGPTTLGRTLNLGQWGQFGVDVHNTGLTPAWDARILDRLPDGPTGGMCVQTPEILSARVFAADGVTPVPGKGALVAGTDYTLAYAGAPTCELTLSLRTAAAAIGPDERLVVTYRTKLDADTQDGIALTNVAGATQWFNDDDTNPERITYTRALTNGTVGVPDHEDAHTVTTALYGYFFEKSVQNLTSGANPATTAEPGDVLRYTLRLQSTDAALDDLSFRDDEGALNPTVVFVPGSLAIVAGSLPPGADASNTNPSAGTNGAGLLDIRNIDLPAFSQRSLQFDVTLAARINNGTIVTNQADLISGGIRIAGSDDPNVNGQSDPDVAGDEDPTRVTIQSAPYFDVDKISDRPRRRPDGAARGRAFAVHDHRAQHRHVGRDGRDAARRRAPEHGLRCRQHDAERLRPFPDGPGWHLAARERHSALDARPTDAGPHARRCAAERGQRRDGRVRRPRRRGRRGRHDHLEPRFRQRAGRRRPRSDHPTIPPRRPSTTRHAISSAICRSCSRSSRRRCRRTARRPASSIRATCCATRSRSTTTATCPRPMSSCATACPPTRPTSRTR
jgi:hypothetical protein